MYWLPYSSYTSHHPSQTPCLPWISYASQKLMLDSCKMVKSSLKHFIRFCGIIFSSLKQNFIAYRSSKVSDCIFEIHQLWQSGFSRVYSNCYCSCSFEPKILKTGQSSHKMYSNNNNACTKCLETYWRHHVSLSSSLLHFFFLFFVSFIFLFSSFFQFSNKVQVFIQFYHFFNFILWSVEMKNSSCW